MDHVSQYYHPVSLSDPKFYLRNKLSEFLEMAVFNKNRLQDKERNWFKANTRIPIAYAAL